LTVVDRDGNAPSMSSTELSAAAAATADVDLSLFSLAGRTAVITGASRNIGAALATGFAKAGADLVMVAREAHRLAEHAEHVRTVTGRCVETVATDVADPDAAERIASAAARIGRVDILVNNAFTGGSTIAPITETPDLVWDEVLENNLLGPMRLCRRFADDLAAGGGSIVNVVSGSGLLPTPNMGPYGVSKAALWMLTRYLAVELAPQVRVNALCPGVTTPEGAPGHPIQEALLPLVPLKRFAKPEELVGAAVYLSSAAASYTTGELLIVNGGRPW
jgi:NAD(P)-dependent dehydrogenase (short-subunit alcohol dehydrogenase family)